jgi:hypothetical protein
MCRSRRSESIHHQRQETLTAAPREVLELEVRKLKTSMVGPLGGAGGRSTTEVEDIDGGSPRGCWR